MADSDGGSLIRFLHDSTIARTWCCEAKRERYNAYFDFLVYPLGWPGRCDESSIFTVRFVVVDRLIFFSRSPRARTNGDILLPRFYWVVMTLAMNDYHPGRYWLLYSLKTLRVAGKTCLPSWSFILHCYSTTIFSCAASVTVFCNFSENNRFDV